VISAQGKRLAILERAEQGKALNFGLGELKQGVLFLEPIEALYLHEIKGFEAENIEALLESVEGSLDKYIVFRDLSTRGYKTGFRSGPKGQPQRPNEYRGQKAQFLGKKISGVASKGLVVCEGGIDLYSKYWFGQHGVYKREGLGNALVLDQFEAEFLKNLGLLKYSGKLKKIRYFDEYLRIYSEWRGLGFIPKSGFKFGGDFRIYFPGTTPSEFEHSKHVMQVFPERYTIEAGEWARAVRISHGIRKTFILAIPELVSKLPFRPDMFAEREGAGYAVKVFYESDVISGRALHSALSYCAEKGIRMLIAIVDRDTSVSYYTVERVILEGSKNMYFEIGWFRP
jgi:tRNA splicing endonuclease